MSPSWPQDASEVSTAFQQRYRQSTAVYRCVANNTTTISPHGCAQETARRYHREARTPHCRCRIQSRAAETGRTQTSCFASKPSLMAPSSQPRMLALGGRPRGRLCSAGCLVVDCHLGLHIKTSKAFRIRGCIVSFYCTASRQ